MKKPTPRRSREDWIHAALEVLRDEGVERVRVEPLAVRLGVTKGSFYWHFETREQLLTAALDLWAELSTEAIIQHVAKLQAGPEAKLRELWRRTVVDARSDFRTELAIRELGQRDPAVRERVKQVDERRMTFLCELFRELGLSPELAQARSLMLYSLLIGNHFIAARHGRMSRARVLELSVDQLLEHSRSLS
jgi:AcrR family transcriptional regulator